MHLGLYAETFPYLILLQNLIENDLLRFQTLQFPKFIKIVVVKEEYFGIIIKCNEPSLGIQCNIIVAWAMAQDSADFVPSDWGRLHDT